MHYLRLLGYETTISGKLHYVGADQLHGFEERLTTDIYPADLGWTARWQAPGEHSLVPAKAEGEGVGSCDIVNDAGPYARSMQMDYDEEVFAQGLQKIYDIARSPRERPFFLKVSFTQPHDPYIARREDWDLYAESEIPAPAVPAAAEDAHSRELMAHYSIDRFPISPENTLKARRAYFAMISDMDRKIGRLLEALAETGLARDTAVVFTSDHGDMMGEHGLWFKKTFYDWAMRVPLIVTPAGGQAARRVTRKVSHLDLLPTLVELAGGRAENIVSGPDGASLLPDVLGDGGQGDRVLAEHLDEGTRAPRFMIRQGDHKYVASPAYPPLLFDLARDPEEEENLAASPAMAGLVEDFERTLAATWDPAALTEQILDNQRRRALVHAALTRGRWTDWDYAPPYRAGERLVRHRDDFPEVERRGYLPYAGS